MTKTEKTVSKNLLYCQRRDHHGAALYIPTQLSIRTRSRKGTKQLLNPNLKSILSGLLAIKMRQKPKTEDGPPRTLDKQALDMQL